MAVDLLQVGYIFIVEVDIFGVQQVFHGLMERIGGLGVGDKGHDGLQYIAVCSSTRTVVMGPGGAGIRDFI